MQKSKQHPKILLNFIGMDFIVFFYYKTDDSLHLNPLHLLYNTDERR